jgi:hypothetical protein
MDYWHTQFVRAERIDSVRLWADLEGKSPTTRDDLYRQQAEKFAPNHKRRPQIAFHAELLVVAVEIWRHSRN